MHLKDAPIPELVSALGEGWSGDRPDAPRELMTRLSARWHSPIGSEWAGRSSYQIPVDANQVRLQGACELGCLVLGAGANAAAEAAAFWERLGGAGRIGLVFAGTPELAEAARRGCPEERCAFLIEGEMETALTHPRPLEHLTQLLRAQLPIRVLLPYTITHDVKPNMFFGRENLIDRLIHEETTNFAIAGPGRIGKSSLIKHVIYLQRKKHRERARRVRYIDCLPYAALSADELARRIALDVAADSEANRVNMATLLRFLKRVSLEGRQPLELFFDEVDSVCWNPTFQMLGEAVKLGLCRVVLCGKSVLHAMMRSRDGTLACRLELIQPEPLEEGQAERLLFEPLHALGFSVQEPGEVRDGVFTLTRRMPHLLQACAKQLVEFAIEEKTKTITPAHLRRVREESGSMYYGLLPLDEFSDNLTRLMTLLIIRSGCGPVNVGRLQQLAGREGVALTASKAVEICYELWICNVLIQERGVFSLTNHALVDFVEKLGVLPGEIARLLRLVPHLKPSDLHGKLS